MARTDIEAAVADRDEAKDMMEIATQLVRRAAITTRERTKRKNILRKSQARLASARAGYEKAVANLKLYRDNEEGASLRIAKIAVDQARAVLRRTEIDLEIRTVLSPISGKVLQVNLKPGEFAKTGILEEPLIVLGDVTPLHIRVDVDEIDIPLWKSTAPAVALIRGKPRQPFKLKFVRREPLVVPKNDLSGASSERGDTRVMQVIYEIQGSDSSMLVGQQLDVFIEARRPSLQATIAPASRNGEQGGVRGVSSESSGQASFVK